MMKRLTCWAVAAMMLSATVAPVVAAEPEPNTSVPDDALSGQASALHQQGMAHIKAGAFEKAHAALAAAWGIDKHFRIAGALGAVEGKLGKYRDAAEHMHYFLKRFPKDGDAKDRARAMKLYDSVVTKVVRLKVVVSPTDARAAVNGVSVVAGELGFYEPGTYEITATYGKAHARDKRTLTVGSNETVLLTVDPQDGVTEPPPESGVDERLIASTVIGVGALAGLAVGIGGMVAAGGYADDADALRTEEPFACTPPMASHCESLKSTMDSHNSAQDLAVGGFVVGGVLAGTSAAIIAWWALDQPADGDAQLVGVAPSFDGESGQLWIMGVW